MIIYPAMDLIDGACVRLQKGDFDTQKTYNENPFKQAEVFKNEGAEWLHIVDLTGAKEGCPSQTKLIQEIANSTSLKIQTGGGIRTTGDVRKVLGLGINRVVIGSMAVKEPETIDKLVEEFGPYHFVIALDVKKIGPIYYVATHGWQETSDLTLSAALHIFSGFGLKEFLVTDISKDGLLEGPNFELYEEFCKKFPDINIQASGGVSGLHDLPPLKKVGASGVIIGKAIYEGLLTVNEALKEVKS